MYRALLTKELRDVAGIAIVSLLAHLWVVTSVSATGIAPWSSQPLCIPFVDQAFDYHFAVVMALTSIALGLWQTAGESVGSTYLFLLHRPVPRTRLIVVKLIVGASILLGFSAVSILFYSLWAATPGTHGSPFSWSLTAWTWQVWFLMSVVYLGAFLSGLRPARWVGTRLAPLFASGVLAGVAFVCLYWRWTACDVVSVVAIVLFISMILFVAKTRDYP